MADTIALEPTGQSAQVVKPTPATPPAKPAPSAPVIATDPSAHSDQVQKMYDGPTPAVYYNVTSFVEWERAVAADEAANEVVELTEQFRIIVGNIMYDPNITNKTAAVNRATAEFTARLDGAATGKEKTGILAKVRGFFGGKEKAQPDPLPTEPEPHNSFTVWKDKDTGGYRWLAVYSNNFRDQDNPPEIISEQSHKSFVDMVDSGATPMPELWHWHIPGTRWGVADWVDYADGFALASGTVDAGHEKEAENLSQMDGLRVSHGMPSRFIVRNKEDSSIIDFHVTSEISPLPGWAAANALTEFVVLNKELDMAFTAEKRKYLVQAGLDEGAIKELESNLANKAQAAKQAGIEHKEAAPPTAEAQPVEVEQPADPAPSYTTAQDVADAVSAVMTPVMAMLTSMNDRMGAVEAEVKELRTDDSEKIAKAAAGTPRASLQDLIAQSLSGMAPLDGRTSLAKAGPKEAADETPGATPSPLLNGLMNKARGGA